MRSLITRLTDSLQGIKAIKAMGREEHLQPLLESETRGINKAQERQVIATEAVVAAQEPILVVLLAGGLLAVLTYTATSFASVLVMAFLFHRLAGRIGTIQINYQAITAGEHYFWSLRESIAGAEAERERSAGMKPPEVSRGIILDRVSFAYSDDVVLQDVSLTIPARGMVALFGPSGVGKTTVADLVVGLYTPTSGRILIDGIPLDSIDLANWRQRIGYVPQEMFLFHDTVFANLALGDPDVTRADAERALTAAGAGTFVAALPEGLDTVLGERGSRLSGGQRQRIAIARALIRRPSLLVLDEVTTALDPATEAAICQTLQELATETAILAISHQPAITQAADVVYRLQDGKAIRADPVAPVTT
jgi:ATP-binding cassette subfamily C protein